MARSAIDSRRERTVQAITRAAQLLTDERGLDGFTMEQLAEQAGVSRRTLFNYFPSKLDAILGAQAQPDPELLARFLAGGPSGHLIDDVRALALGVLEGKADADAVAVGRVRQLLRADPRILHAAHARFERASEHFNDLIRQRDDAIDEATARVVVRLIMTVFDVALDAYLEHPGRSMAEHFTTTFDTLEGLLRSR